MFRIIGVIIGVLLITVFAVIVFAQPILEGLASRQLAKAGFSDINVDITELSSQKLAIGVLAATHDESKQTLALDNIEIEFHWRDLWKAHRVQSISIGPGHVVGSVSEEGDFQIAGVPLGGGGGGDNSEGLPFSSLVIDGLSFAMATPAGVVDGEIDGTFNADRGGEIEFSSSTAYAGLASFSLKDFASEGKASFSDKGKLDLSVAVTGAIETKNAQVRAIDATASVTGGSWRKFFDDPKAALNGSAIVVLKNAELEANAHAARVEGKDATSQSVEALINDVYGVISASGTMTASFKDGGIFIIAEETSLDLKSEKGNALSLTALSDEPLLSHDGEQTVLGAKLVHRGAFEGHADISATSNDTEKWTYKVVTSFDRQLIDRTILRDASLVVEGVASSTTVSGMVDGDVTVSGASVGRFRLKNAPISTMLNFDVDLEGQTLVVAGEGKGCIKVAQAAMRVLEQDLESQLRNAKLCADGNPLLSVDWSGAPRVVGLGEITADWASYRLGETTMVGAPPRINFAANYEPDNETTRIVGDYVGGAITINSALVAKSAKGKFVVGLIGDALTGKASMSDAIITQAMEPILMAPLRVNGAGALANNIVNFDMAVETLNGHKVAKGNGIHNVESGVGEADYTTIDLEFLPEGLQPDDIVSAMRGEIEKTSGIVQSNVHFAWGQETLRSSGNFSLAGLKFVGPEPVITQTSGVSGDIELSDLMPVATKGVQTIAIGSIELGALILENGLIEFELPGDDTLNVVSASFPWFGGSIGAYNSQTPLSGGNAETVLKAEDVNLQDLLAQLDIEGLSGEGTIAGTLPISVVDGKAFIKDGLLEAVGSGVIRYQGAGTDAAAESNQQANVAFGILRELRFETLTAKINGPLDGNLNFDILMEGRSALPITDPRVKEDVSAPVIYRVNFEDVPLLALFEQAQISTDIRQQLERARNGQNNNGAEQ